MYGNQLILVLKMIKMTVWLDLSDKEKINYNKIKALKSKLTKKIVNRLGRKNIKPNFSNTASASVELFLQLFCETL